MGKLENLIMSLWSSADDIQLLRTRLLDGAEPMSEDDIDNCLLGFISIINLRGETLYEEFRKLAQEKSNANDSDDML
jgi:hypothetical protein